jgi:hypothetical protein
MSYEANEVVWSPRKVSATAEDQWSDPLRIAGKGVVTITSAGAGTTFSLQFSTDDGATWDTVDTVTGAAVDQYEFDGQGVYRIGCAVDDFGAAATAMLERGAK